MSRVPKIIIISGASGSGKTTLVNYLLSCKELNLTFSVSACTRKKRASEIDGQNYIFLSIEEFNKKINQNEFVEWEEVYKDHFYGTLKNATMQILKDGKNLLFDVDIQGAYTIKKYFKSQAIGIFIKAPSIDIAKKRLIKRQTESKKALQFRVDKIEEEIEMGKKMDHQLLNDDLDKSKSEIYGLIHRFIVS
ncbi:MAG: guanylate kinase [Flavobacteriales bacterium]|nr:guanylate kinase [Flavobacteriales bacterium]|tara:strand:+ start:19971 stop:20546 length:576 start_codon:yes stop_codon:yes gene_type:complete